MAVLPGVFGVFEAGTLEEQKISTGLGRKVSGLWSDVVKMTATGAQQTFREARASV
jgi:hypothetical protein